MGYGFSMLDIPSGFGSQQMEQAYQLSNGTILFSSGQDLEGCYWGAVGMDGMYLRTCARYRPVRNEHHQIIAFRKLPPPDGIPHGPAV